MQLWINTVTLQILENIENILFSDDRTIAQWFMKHLPGEVYEELSPQYELQVMSWMQIRKTLGGNVFKNIKGFYFGTEQCEFLLPTLDEVKKAIEFIKQFDKKYVTNKLKQFVFVSPYYWHRQIRQRLIEILQYLNENAKSINPQIWYVEVVVNDFGTLKLLQDFENLKPILGRLLVKTLKNPIVDTFGLEKNIHIPWVMMKNKSLEEIEELKKQLAAWQMEFFKTTSLTNDKFLAFFEKYGINRFGLDYLVNIDYKKIVQQSQTIGNAITDNKEAENKGIELDIYYPYALIFVWRLCDTSAIENIRRGYYPVDEVCPRTCMKYDLFIKNFETVWYKLIQRWNAQYKTQINLFLPQEVVEDYRHRLIYQPLI